MKRIFAFLLALLFTLPLAACGAGKTDVELEISDMKEICELAVMDCYYHNVAKYNKENTQGFLWWKKDTHFWIEYTGIVTLGIDAEKVDVEVKGHKVKITLPQAKVLNIDLDEKSMKDYIDDDSAKILAENKQEAVVEAQKHMKAEVEANQELLNSACNRAKMLLENYINNIGELLNITYEIEWNYLDEA